MPAIFFACLVFAQRIQSTLGRHMIFYTYIRTELIRIFVIISLLFNEFSYSKVQIPHRFCSSHYPGAVSMNAVNVYTTASEDVE